MAEMVLVRRKDLVKVIEKADDCVHWGSSTWKARKRLLEAVGGMEECYRCVTGSLRGAPDDAFVCSSCAHFLTSSPIKSYPIDPVNNCQRVESPPGGKVRIKFLDECLIPACGCPGDRSHP